MGRIYVDPRTGAVWESTRRRRRPPPGFVETRYFINYKYVRRKDVEVLSVRCPECREYHAYVVIMRALWQRKLAEFAGRYGCKVAEALVGLARCVGGQEVHYDLAERVYLAAGLEAVEEAWELASTVEGLLRDPEELKWARGIVRRALRRAAEGAGGLEEAREALREAVAEAAARALGR